MPRSEEITDALLDKVRGMKEGNRDAGFIKVVDSLIDELTRQREIREMADKMDE